MQVRRWMGVMVASALAAAWACSADGGASQGGGGFQPAGAGGASGSGASGGATAGAGASSATGGGSGAVSSGGSGASAAGQSSGGSSGSGPTAGGAGGSPTDASLPDVSFNYDPPDAAEDACSAVSAEATTLTRPIDIIFVIDNSGSMGGEIEAVQDNINTEFAQIIGASGIDYRVIMLSRHGALGGESVCIEAPLSSIPSGGCANPPAQPGNSARFFHYSEEIASEDSLCKILETFAAADDLGLAPNGWQEWLRPESFKMFVEITDDQAACSSAGFGFDVDDQDSVAGGTATADAFNQALTTLSPLHFGTADDRNYRFHSIVALRENSPDSEPWPPTAPIQTGECSPDAEQPGTGYQALSILTEGLRYPSCENDSFDAIFRAMAQGVIEGAAVPCEFAIPTPDAGVIDPSKVEVEYVDGGGATQVFGQVGSAAACGSGDGFYLDDPVSPSRLFLCPATCTAVQADEDAQINVLLGCLGA